MKKFATILTIALIFSVCSTAVITAGPMNGRNFVDADGDGICDNTKYTIKYKLNGGKNNKKNPWFFYAWINGGKAEQRSKMQDIAL